MRRLLAALILCLWPTFLWGQAGPPATLIADNIRFDRASERVTASGTVEVFFENTVLRASSISYSGPEGELTVQGPLTLTDASGQTVILADFGQVSSDLQNGVLRSARLVLDRQLQIAANEVGRVEGRYTQLNQTVASSCRVCADRPTPIWEIRARRVTHDQEVDLLWFEEAQFRIAGVPVAYFPRLRMPGPTLNRANGFLIPNFFFDDTIGNGVRLPYFITLGNNRDLTFTPYLSDESFFGLGFGYRQAFYNGWVTADGQISFDELTDDSYRGYLFLDGAFFLPRRYVLDVQAQLTSDRGYLTTYDISDADRLENHVILSRANRNQYIEAGLTRLESIRDGEDNSLLPNTIFDAQWTRRYDVPGVGGVARLSFGAHSHLRENSDDITGRDVSWVFVDLDWRRDWVLPAGFLLATEIDLYNDRVLVREDSTFPDEQSRYASAAAVELSWPLSRVGNRGVSHLIEPTMQLAWSDDGGGNIPNEDSTIVGFDEANLFDLNRFPGQARREDGGRVALGVSYTRADPLGWSLGGTLGRVWRLDDNDQFTPGSGLDGRRSDWLAALHLSLGEDIELINRALFDEDLQLTSNETALQWTADRHELISNFTWLEADPAEGRPNDTSELYLEGTYRLENGWSAGADWRYDFASNETTRAGFALNFRNECVDLELSVSRRITQSASVDPSTSFGLRVALLGFGGTSEPSSEYGTCR